MQVKELAEGLVDSEPSVATAPTAAWRDVFALMVPGVFSVASIIGQVRFDTAYHQADSPQILPSLVSL
jgi:hypothetical protein